MRKMFIRSVEAEPRRPFGGFKSTHEIGRRIHIDGHTLGKHVLVSYGVETLSDDEGHFTGEQIHVLKVLPVGPVIAMKSEETLQEKEAVEKGLELLAQGTLPQDSTELLQEGYKNFNCGQVLAEALLLRTIRQFTQEP